MSKKKRKLIFLIIALFIGIMIFILLVKGEKEKIRDSLDEGSSMIHNTEDESESSSIEEEKKSYITETSFDGAKELDPLVFQYPFKKTETHYVSNKNLVKNVDEKQIEEIQKRAAAFVKEFYEIHSKELIKGYMEKENNLKRFFSSSETFVDENAVEKTGKIYAQDYIMAVANAELTTEVKFITDKCLVYKDRDYWVRGIMEITIYDCTQKPDLSAYYSWDVERGKTYTVILDIGLFPETSRKAETFRVSFINVIDYREEVKGE